jgi:hypothetical protein
MLEDESEEYEEVDVDGNYADALLRNHGQNDGFRVRAQSSEYDIKSQG